MTKMRRYSIKARKIRVGDEIQAADGVSWLDPVRAVEVGAKRHGAVEVWIQRALFNDPDHEFYDSQTIVIRRQVGTNTGSNPTGSAS